MGRRAKQLTEDEVKGADLFEELADHMDATEDELIGEVWSADGRDKKRRFTGKVRVEMWRRDKGACFYCGILLPLGARWHADHVVPHARGGRTVLLNGVVACPRCNRRKSAKWEGLDRATIGKP